VGTPAGVQTGEVPLAFTLTSEEVDEADVSVKYSTDGAVFREASEASGSDGTRNLSVSEAGDQHTFIWDSDSDLGGARTSSTFLRVSPDSGGTAVTGSFTVNNGRFLAAVETREQGRVRLYELNAVSGDVTFRSSVDTGGDDPYDIAYGDGYFFVAHERTNNVAALRVDEEAFTLTLADGSPVTGDGANAKYLAVDDDLVFVANTGDGTLTIFDFDSDTGALTLNEHSGVAAPSCRGLVIRSGRLYVASEANGEILIFDIGTDGELLVNGSSPVTTGGLDSPRAMITVGTRLYAANFATATVCGFNLQGGGGLGASTGSPFTVSNTGIEDLGALDAKLVGTVGGGARLFALTVDAFGALAEDADSPFTLTGPAFGVTAAGLSVVLGTTTSRRLEVWTENSSGTLVATVGSPLSAGVEIRRVATSD